MHDSEIIEFLKKKENIESYLNDNEILNTDNLRSFFLKVSAIPSQRYGNLIAKKVASILDLREISQSSDQGDYRDINDKKYEIKSSILRKNGNKKINVVQIRQWQDIDYYLIMVINLINLENDNVEYDLFFISKENMEIEIKKCGGSSAHISKIKETDNKKIEKRFSIKYRSDNYNRWKINYGIGLNDLMDKIKANI